MKPCPFCGSSKLELAEEAVDTIPGESVKHAFIRCLGCGARGPTSTSWLSPKYREYAETRWDALDLAGRP